TPSLTLILAATPSLGIGKAGALPWPQLKKEMGFFARVTKRTSPSTSTTSEGKRKRSMNVVLMGRKTWDSIPPRFRPLKDRLNVVVTRDAEGFKKGLGKGKEGKEEAGELEGPMVCESVLDALSRLHHYPHSLPTDHPEKLRREEGDVEVEVANIFVIGGATIYATALALPQTKRVLLTKIHKEYECDTFFPVNIAESAFWREAGREEMRRFTGEEEGGVVVQEQGVEFEFCMF
ncbi:hypothetical protein EJ02DRAFT_296922, partial [Clathrospora elynae]